VQGAASGQPGDVEPESESARHPERGETGSGLLARWDRRNQRIVERQVGDGQRREREWRDAHFRVTTPEGKRLVVWAQPSGYPFRFIDGSGDWPDLILLPLVYLLAKLRHRYQFHGGWSVAVLAPGRWFERRRSLERFPSREEAKTRARLLAEHLGSIPDDPGGLSVM